MEMLLAFLQQVHPLSPQLVEHLTQILQNKKVARKEFLLRVGHVNRNIYFVESGLFRCYYDKDNKEVCSWFMQAGDVMVSIESFYSRTPSYEWIQALEESEVWYISYEQLYHIYHTYPEFNFIGRELTQQYHILWAKQLYGIRMQSVAERYAWLLENFPHLALRVPAKYLASWLGVNESHFSVIKGR